MKKRVGIFGGSFDPPHLGHLIVAERAREELGLGLVVFVPSSVAPHKQRGSVASSNDRLRMTSLAVKGHSEFAVSPFEIRQNNVCYTVDAVEYFSQHYNKAELYFLIGEDNLRGFRSWKSPSRILELAKLAAYHRGKPLDKRSLRGMSHGIEWISGEQIPISSSDIRHRRERGRSIRFLVPDAVHKYIVQRALYTTSR